MLEFLKTWIFTAIFVACALVIFTAESFAVTGYRVGGSCYSTINEAADSYYSAITPIVTSGASGITETVFTAGTGKWQANTYQYTSTGKILINTAPTNIHTARFLPCDLPVNPTYSPEVAASFWAVAFFFTIGCWLLAKNYGLILQAIKRW